MSTEHDTSGQNNQEDNDIDQLAFEIRGPIEINGIPPEVANSAPIPGVNNPSTLVTPPEINIAPKAINTNNVIVPFRAKRTLHLDTNLPIGIHTDMPTQLPRSQTPYKPTNG